MNIVKEVRLVNDANFLSLKISPNDFLNEIKGRTPCSRCNKSRKYFCYTCYVPVGGIGERLPNVQLPFYVDIIKHSREVDGKSTATHAAILAPQHVNIYTYPNFPSYFDKSKVLIVFPGPKSLTLDDVKVLHDLRASRDADKSKCEESFSNGKTRLNDHSCSSEGADSRPGVCNSRDSDCARGDDNTSALNSNDVPRCATNNFCMNDLLKQLPSDCVFPFKRVIFIDSTWNQVQAIINDQRLEGIPRVELKNRETLFWRFQRGKPKTYLSTIEAIYYFLVDSHSIFTGEQYDSEYDNLLFFFHFMYKKIHSLYDYKTLRVNTMQ